MKIPINLDNVLLENCLPSKYLKYQQSFEYNLTLIIFLLLIFTHFLRLVKTKK